MRERRHFKDKMFSPGIGNRLFPKVRQVKVQVSRRHVSVDSKFQQLRVMSPLGLDARSAQRDKWESIITVPPFHVLRGLKRRRSF